MSVVYFHIDELARDSIVASVLKKELKQRNIDLIYGNRSYFRFLNFFRFFDLFILPSMGHFQAIFHDEANLPKNIAILPSEAIGQATGHLRRMNAKYFGNDEKKSTPWHKVVIAYFLWGYDHLHPFENQHPEYLEKCKVIGYPRLDSRCLPKRNSNRKKLKNKKIKVGFISRFGHINSFIGRSIFESVYAGMKRDGVDHPAYENSQDRDVEDCMYTEMIDFRLTLKIIEKIDLSKFEIFLRPYPREDRFKWYKLTKEKNLNITISTWDEPFSIWLSKMDFIISPPSTTFYEAIAVGHSPICTMDIVPHRKNHILTESDDNNQILQYTQRPKTIKNLLAMLNDEKQCKIHPDVKKILMAQTASDIASHSITNLADACEKLINKNSPSVKNQKFIAFFFKVITRSFSYILYIRNILLKGGEQGSTFAMTGSRSQMIDSLSNYIHEEE
jgi:surface carbohydrate biosynthesis protein